MNTLQYSKITEGGGRTKGALNKKGKKSKGDCQGHIQMECHRRPTCKYIVGPTRHYCRSARNKVTCRGSPQTRCVRRSSCKYASGSKRQFCRTARNKRRLKIQ